MGICSQGRKACWVGGVLQLFLGKKTSRAQLFKVPHPQIPVCVCVSRLVVSDSLWPHWTVARQAPVSMGFSRQEYWSGLPFPTLEDLPNPGIKP